MFGIPTFGAGTAIAGGAARLSSKLIKKYDKEIDLGIGKVHVGNMLGDCVRYGAGACIALGTIGDIFNPFGGWMDLPGDAVGLYLTLGGDIRKLKNRGKKGSKDDMDDMEGLKYFEGK
jgi:hypothetical protein